MLQESKIISEDGKWFVEIQKIYSDSLFSQYKIRFYDAFHDVVFGKVQRMNISGYITVIKDKNKLLEFEARTKHKIDWWIPKVDYKEEANGFISYYYLLWLKGKRGGEICVKRLTKPETEENAYLILECPKNWKHAFSCNINDRFCFFPYHVYYKLRKEV